MHSDRDELAVTLGNDNCLYAIGGFGGENQTSLDSAERFNLKTLKWEKIASMNVKRRALTAVCLPDGIYAIGGFDGQNYLSSVEKYDENLNKWIFLSPLNHPRCTFSSIISPDFKYIYAIGGFNNRPLDTVERYSVVTENWEVINIMPNKRFMHNCILIQQQVYSNQNSPYIYKENY
ncbi:hypothetical protein PPERSA_11403 [Pseudocohnilembus persalinus]|uniref:Galactose oxidase/kelch, beta-propeller n=1 Tax=Pseudocohnilembus persalinus TaxID=266149 RepID=A0A0V0QQ90_PSEPJ|nr:hypothetical protein PPERSA_11403 [Pseudocohnilembus persalinus]|eukprot:KRX04279.1 hypothetical protein PPERSA_11403 [Pseudocohnilembus persalinus]